MIQKVLKNKRDNRAAKFSLWKVLIVLCGSVLLFSSTSWALPEVGEIVSGEVVISNPNPQTLQIDASHQTIINYNSFNIAENESVIVNLPNASNEILNRVTGNGMSSLLGSLVCNGVFILTNPNGINIGATANIDAAGFIASTRDITNEDFLQSQHIFEKVFGKQDTQLVNKGTINIRKGGFGILIAGAVKNEGVISANVGTVALAAGDKVSVDISGDGLVSVNIDQETAETIYDINGNPITTQIINTGSLQANGGQVILGAKSATDVFRAAINLEGIVQAMDVEEKDGKIILKASGDIIVNTPLETGSVDIESDTHIKVEKSITATSGDINIYADHDGDGRGELTQSPGTIIQATAGNIYLDGSGIMTLAGVKAESGTIKVGTRQAPSFIDAQTPLEANTLTLIGTSFDVNSLALTTDISKLGDLQIQNSTLEGNLARLQGDGVNITYLTTNNLTLRSNNVIDTSPGVIIQANQVRLIGRQFGTLAVPLNIHASQITLQRTLGSIDILESIGMGEIIAMRAPPNGFGYIMYNRDATLVLEAQNGSINILKDVTLSARNLTLISTTGIYCEGSLLADHLSLLSDGPIYSLGTLQGNTLYERGASFNVGGIFNPGYADLKNADNAITYSASASIGPAIINDADDIIINDGVTMTLTGDVTWNAGTDGSGAFTMLGTTSAIAGGGYNLTISASSASTLTNISNVNLLTLSIPNTIDGDVTFTSDASCTFSVTTLATNWNATFGHHAVFSRDVIVGGYHMIYSVSDAPGGLQYMGHDATTLGYSYKLANNINVSETSNWNSGDGFLPVGDAINKFSGNFDGDEHTISGLTINRPSTDYVGLFGRVNGSAISDVGVVLGQVTASDYVGSLVGYLSSGTISNSYATGDVTITGGMSGGLVGFNNGTISNSYSTGNVTGSGVGSYIGGLVGYNNKTISNSYCTGTVTGYGILGGLVGSNANLGTISNSYATGNVTGTGGYIGGLVGYSRTISNCYATGDVTNGSGIYVGGLIGWQDGGTVTNSYYAGIITTSAATDKGGLIGYVNGSPTYTSNYWNQTLNPTLHGVGATDPAGVTGKTTAQMKQQATFVGWNFTTPWCIAEAVTYPLLRYSAFIWNNGSGVDSNWSTAANWLGGIAPTAGVIVAFNGDVSSSDSIVDLGFGGTIAGITIASTYTGTITQARSLTVAGNFSQSGGIFDLSGNTLNVGGNFTISGGTFTNNSTLTFDGIGTSTVTDSRGTLGDLGAVVVDGTSKTINLASNIKATSLSIGADDIFGLSTYTLYITGSGMGGAMPFQNSGTFNENTGTVTYTSSAATDILGETYYNLTINGAGPFNQNAGSVVNVTNDFTMTTGTYNQNEDLTITNAFSMAAGTFTSDATTPKDFSATSFALNGGTFSRFTDEGGGLKGIIDVYGLQAMKCYLSSSFILKNNIDASGTENWDTDDDGTPDGFIPVGTSASPFSGNLDGDNYTVSGLFIDRPATLHTGLFGYTSAGEIKDLALTGVNITGYQGVDLTQQTASLVAYNYSTITNCSVTGVVSAYRNVAGFVSRHYSTISDSYSTATVTGTGSNYAAGFVAATQPGSIILRCYATGDVTGRYWTAGFVGYNLGTISESYATGNATAVGASNCIGGFAGQNDGVGIITDCYATGDAVGWAYVGGFVGRYYDGAISNSYSIGTATQTCGDEYYVGGFVGLKEAGADTLVSCYYDSETSGRSDVKGGSTPKTTVEMKQQATFVGWDFADTWYLFEGSDYPKFDWTAFIWNNGAGLGDLAWSTDANWVGGVAPSATDTVIFDNTSDNPSTVDMGTIANILIRSTYDGTITQGISLSVTDNYSQAAGTFVSADNDLTVYGDLSVSGGLLDASDALAVLAIGDDLTVSGTGKFYSPTTSDYTQFAVVGDVTLSDSAIFTNNGILQFYTSPSSVLIDNRTVPSNIGAVVLTTSSTVTLGSDIKASAFAVANTCVLNLDTYTLTLTNAGQGADQPFQVLAGGTFNADAGTIKLMGVGDTDIEDTTYYNLILNQAGTTFYSTGDTTVSNVLTVETGATLNAQDDTWHLTGTGTPFMVNGTFESSSSTVSYEGAGATDIAATTYYDLYLDQAGTTFTSIGETTVSDVLTFAAGTFNADDDTWHLTGSGTPFVATGTFNGGTSTFIYEGPSDTNITGVFYYNLEINAPIGTSPTYTLPAGDLLKTHGSFSIAGDGQATVTAAINNGNLMVWRNFSIDADGVFVKGTGYLNFCTMVAGTYIWTDNNPVKSDLGIVIIGADGVAGTVSLGSDLKASGVFIYTAGSTLDLGNYTLTLTGSGTGASMPFQNNGTFNEGAGTIVYAGAGATDILSETYYDLIINGAGTFAPTGDLDINDDLTLTAGTFNAGANTLTIGGDFTNNATFNAGTGMVTFDDVSQVSNVYGTTTFNDFKNITAGKVLNFEAEKIQIIAGVLTLTGAAGNLIDLRSSVGGTQWKIDPQGTRSVSYADVKDSNNINALIINPLNSMNSGNNINWFNATPIPPEPEIDHSTIDNNPVIILLNFFVPFVEAGIESFNFGDWQDAFNPGFNSFAWEEGESKYGKGIYNSGKYRTIAALVEGKIVFGAYDENGLDEEGATVIMPGETQIMQGEVGGDMLQLGFNLEVAVKDEGEVLTTAVYFPGKYKTTITAIEGIFDVTPYDEENVYSDHTSVIQAGQTAIQAREIK